MLLYEAHPALAVEDLDGELTRAFEIVRRHLAEGETVVVLVDDEDLEGHRGPAQTALAFGLLGLVRALAIEGKRDGWQISMLATASDLAPADRLRWTDHMKEGPASGSLVRLGDLQLGRLPA